MDAPAIQLEANFVRLDYQGEPQAVAPLAPAEKLALAFNAFPKSVPLSFRSGPPLHGIKLFASTDRVYYSRFADTGACDAWQRPVLSAVVAILAHQAWFDWGRNLFLLDELLASEQCFAAPLESVRQFTLQRADAFWNKCGQDWWHGKVAATGLSCGQLGRLAAASAHCARLAVYHPQPEVRDGLFQLLHLFQPASSLQDRVATSYCHDPLAMDREPVVWLDTPTPKPRWWITLSRALVPNRFHKGTIVINLETGRLPYFPGPIKPEVYAVAFHELTEGEDWTPLAFHEKARLLVLCLDAIAQGQWPGLAEYIRKEGLPDPAASLIRRFASRLRSAANA